MALNHRFPPEILDHIVDLLHDDPVALEQCCLVSKSWVARTRKHLFAAIAFCTQGDIQAWKATFPDASNSPGYYTRTLTINCPEIVTAADVKEGGWIRAFLRVVCLDLDSRLSERFLEDDPKTIYAPFHKISPTVKTLNVTSFFLSRSEVFNLVHSFPLLEDLTLMGKYITDHESDGSETVDPPATSPPLTGSLDLTLPGWMTGTVRRLLDLPNGIRFRKVNVCCVGEDDNRSTVELVVGCSETLEHLDLMYHLKDGITPFPIDLSRATRLKIVVFRCLTLECGWVTGALETISSKHRGLKQISIHIPSTSNAVTHEDRDVIEQAMKEAEPGTRSLRWPELDRFLVQFLESRTIRVTAVYPPPNPKYGTKEMEDWARYLFPESTRKGIVDLAEQVDSL